MRGRMTVSLSVYVMLGDPKKTPRRFTKGQAKICKSSEGDLRDVVDGTDDLLVVSGSCRCSMPTALDR
jgi:hypothetical protein